ncbi:Uncharacterised protein [Mycobacterium tuberculosis]|nr:Uncharacterised protein [Mycobacterium tuberculosis]
MAASPLPTVTAARSATTASAPLDSRFSASPCASTAITSANPPFRPARRPVWQLSMTIQRPGFAPSRFAVSIRPAGLGSAGSPSSAVTAPSTKTANTSARPVASSVCP